MLAWLVYINDITISMKGAGAALFLDDVALWISHSDPNEAVRQLNAELARIYDWAIYNTVYFDAKKFHLFDMGLVPLPENILETISFGDFHPSFTEEAPYISGGYLGF